ncbi:MAG: hypothetical protein AB7E96_03250 [Deferribacterales bacterium]
MTILFSVFFFGCATTGDPSSVKLINGKPSWFYTPSLNGKTGGVGVSGIHVDGKTGQKSLAAQRALEEIAKQMGVKVSSFSTIRSESDNNGSSVSGQSSSFFTVDGTEVKAKIVEMWEDPYTHELYVWMVAQ